jgi:hypothetical protein
MGVATLLQSLSHLGRAQLLNRLNSLVERAVAMTGVMAVHDANPLFEMCAVTARIKTKVAGRADNRAFVNCQAACATQNPNPLNLCPTERTV